MTEVEQVVERSAAFEAAPDELWDAITDPGLLAEWFGPVELDLVPGGPITMTEPDDPAVIGVVETVDPCRRIGFVWLAPGSDVPSSVELEIDADEHDGSILRIRETRLEPQWDVRPAWFAATPHAGARA